MFFFKLFSQAQLARRAMFLFELAKIKGWVQKYISRKNCYSQSKLNQNISEKKKLMMLSICHWWLSINLVSHWFDNQTKNCLGLSLQNLDHFVNFLLRVLNCLRYMLFASLDSFWSLFNLAIKYIIGEYDLLKLVQKILEDSQDFKRMFFYSRVILNFTLFYIK